MTVTLLRLFLFCTYSTFERLLNAKLREEEKLIPVLVPDVKKYQLVEN